MRYNSPMEILYGVLHLIAVALLIVVMGVRLEHTSFSQFELARRVRSGDARAKAIQKHEELLPYVASLQRVLTALLIVAVSFLGALTYHWALGLLIALFVALEAGALAHLPFLQRRIQALYTRIEPAVLRFVDRFKGVLRVIKTVSPPVEDTTLDSKEELEHLVAQSGMLLSDDQRRVIQSSLTFEECLVKDSMTPRAVMRTVEKDEVLGPLVLDDLHKTGFSRFPVTDGDIDHIVGVLHIQDLLTINSHRTSTTVSEAMERRVYFIHEDQTLKDALNAFVTSKHHLFIVVNEFRETTGVLTLEDVVEALIGREIVDEFDAHEDLRVVAARNPAKINRPNRHVDV